MRSKAGFTLIEAMIALAIAGLGLTMIFQLQYTLVNGQKRHEQALELSTVRGNALALVRDVNFDVTPQGDADLPPNLSLHWTATALGDPVLGAGFPTGTGQYEITLYSVAAEVDDPSGATVNSFEVERMGWTSQAQASAGLTGVAPAPAPTALAQ